METSMFCYQCEQALHGTGCVRVGVCGKDPQVDALQDLLVYELEGLALQAVAVLDRGETIPSDIDRLVMEALFATLTNVNFDGADIIDLIQDVTAARRTLREMYGLHPAADLHTNEEAIRAAAAKVDIRPQAETAVDIQSLKDTLLYGLKGMAAYAYHAAVLGLQDPEVNHFFYRGLAALTDRTLQLNDVLDLMMAFGQVNLKAMALLDQANTGTYGHPEPTHALVSKRKGPFIVVSGHDLHDLKELLEQTAGKGINVYTHGEMLPALAYPGLKKYPHLIGNYGTAWHNQQHEFDSLPGAILMTTNCLMKPRPSYQDRIFSTGVVGYPGMTHIPSRGGKKDFTPVIQKALELGGWTEDEPEKRILIGFGRSATLSHAEEIINAVKTGQIKHFFLVGGCDGAKSSRSYYTEFAEKTPPDSVILTLACGKFRFNDRDFGTVAGLPRLLDVGQCNDAYSAIQIALALAEAFNCGVNDLPLTLVLSWYEQKAVCILLTLLSLGIKNIYLGPSLPAFLSPNVVQYLVEQFGIRPITSPEKDLADILVPA